jgi:plastocyanin
LTPDGPQPAVITVPIWSTVEWTAAVDGTQPPSVRMAQFDNPSLRPLSDIDPLSSTRGFDGGMMVPGQTYRRRFDVPGTYTYTDSAGHTGKVVVTGSIIYLPLVMR